MKSDYCFTLFFLFIRTHMFDCRTSKQLSVYQFVSFFQKKKKILCKSSLICSLISTWQEVKTAFKFFTHHRREYIHVSNTKMKYVRSCYDNSFGEVMITSMKQNHTGISALSHRTVSIYFPFLKQCCSMLCIKQLNVCHHVMQLYTWDGLSHHSRCIGIMSISAGVQELCLKRCHLSQKCPTLIKDILQADRKVYL